MLTFGVQDKYLYFNFRILLPPGDRPPTQGHLLFCNVTVSPERERGFTLLPITDYFLEHLLVSTIDINHDPSKCNVRVVYI